MVLARFAELIKIVFEAIVYSMVYKKKYKVEVIFKPIANFYSQVYIRHTSVCLEFIFDMNIFMQLCPTE